jgi:transposase-like protein
MKHQKTDKKQKEIIALEYLKGNNTYAEIGDKYGINSRSIQRWVKKYEKGYRTILLPNVKQRSQPEKKMPGDTRQLQEELYKARLHNLLLEELLDIGKEKYGIDLRKKTGAKQS